MFTTGTKLVFQTMGRHARGLLGFAILFRVVESLLFAPVAALLGRWLLDRTVLDSTQVVSFLLSPRGLLALMFAAVTALTIRLFEHAGLSAILFGGMHGRRLTAREAMQLVWSELRTLLRASLYFVAVGLGAVVPLALVAGGFAAWLLPKHDVNFYLELRPPEFVAAVAVITVVAVVTAALFAWLVVRWRWVVQVILFQNENARAAFSESAVLTRGIRGRLAAALVGVVLVSAAAGILATVVGDACTSAVLAVVGPGAVSLAVAFAALLLLRGVIAAAFTFLSSCFDAAVFTALYQRRTSALGVPARLPELAGKQAVHRRPPGWLAMAVVAVPLLSAGGVTWLAIEGWVAESPITIHAHRGVWIDVPENTLAAARAAIRAGADYLETDVQLSRDGVLVVAHDNDFSRLGGVATKVWDLTYAEIRAIPLGGGPHNTPGFDELLDETRGHLKLNIELKYYGDHQPGLARKVIEALRQRGMLDQVVIQCLEYDPLLEVRQLAPEVPIGYLLSFNARDPSRLEVDFLSAEQSRINRDLVLRAHRRGQRVYAWTVNRPEDMRRLFDLGVDGIITDQTGLARETLSEYLLRPKTERVLRRARAWLYN